MKTDRHARIIELIDSQDIGTQDELVRLLRAEGYNVTQATVSRDIRQLKLTKISLHDGRQKYAVTRSEEVYADKYIRILKEAYVSVDAAQNILVVKTVAGMAMAVAAALDNMHMPGLVGCIAGDDTVMGAVRSAEEASALMNKIRELVY